MASKATSSTPSASAVASIVTPDPDSMMIVDESESRLSAPREVSMLSKRAQVTGMNGRTFDEDPDGGRGHGGLLSTFLVKVKLYYVLIFVYISFIFVLCA